MHATEPTVGTGSPTRAGLRAAALAATLVLCTGGCTGSGAHRPSTAPPSATTDGHGPDFPLCGGLDDKTVIELTEQTDLADSGKNSTGCQWHRAGGSYRWPRIVFAWYRGSPIGRERRIAVAMGKQVEDLTVNGHTGFIARDENSRRVICEVAVGVGVDFIEWSLSFNRAPLPDACGIATELTRRSIANAR